MTDRISKLIPYSLILSIVFFSCGSKAPVITSISPKIGQTGDVITLTGKNFGAELGDSYITVRGIAPTSSSYYLWQNDLIIFKIPEFRESSIIYIHSKGKKSNGVLFTNSASVPKPVEGEELGLGPRITSINPQEGTVGTLITINGNNFGRSREEGTVYFSLDNESSQYIEVSEIELGYVSWNAREIQVHLPDGAISGSIEVRTPHGRSNPVFFDVSKPGYKNFGEKRSYTISYSVDVKVNEALMPNALYLWIPRPVTSPSQRNVSLVSRSKEPFVENYKGVSLFKLDNLTKGASQSINHSFSVDVYAIETKINPQAIKQEKTPLSAIYTQSSNLISVSNQRLKETVNTIIGREQNPYNKTKIIYDWITKNIQIVDTPSSSGNVISAIESKRSDPYTCVLLFTSMVRCAGVPCIPVAGVLINRNGQAQRHYWIEFWIDNFGWIPVDPVMGTRSNSENYFGNIDNQRIAFSRGELQLSQMENRGQLVSYNQSYSLQNIWEEASGGLKSYTSIWGDITISGIYIQ